MENNTQAFIKDKRHNDEGLCDVVSLFWLPLQMSGPFLNEQTEYFKFRLQLLTGTQLRVSQSN